MAQMAQMPLGQGRRWHRRRALEAALCACADRRRKEGVDLAAYYTRESADDLEHLRRALAFPGYRCPGSAKVPTSVSSCSAAMHRLSTGPC